MLSLSFAIVALHLVPAPRWRFVEASRAGDTPAIKTIEFINGFAANDPVSYVRIWQRLGLIDDPSRVVLVMNIRGDRQRRTKDLAPLFGRQLPAARYVLIGQDTALFADLLVRRGLRRESIADLSRLAAPDLWAALVELAPPECTLVGVGNIGGIGNELLSYLRAKETAA